MLYAVVKSAWDRVSDEKLIEFKDKVPSLISLQVVDLDLKKESNQRLMIIFTNLGEAVEKAQDIPVLKSVITNWLKQIGMVRIQRSDPRSLTLEISNIDVNGLEEAVVKVFTRKGNSLVPAMKCLGGPKNGQRTNDVKTCMQPPSYARRTARKVSSRKNKGAIAKKRRQTKLTNIIGRRRLSKANARLKKARGGKF